MDDDRRAMWTRLTIGVAMVAASIVVGLLAMAGVFARADPAIMRAVGLGSEPTSMSADVTRFVSTFGDVGARGFTCVAILALLLARARWRSALLYVVVIGTSIAGHTLAKLAFARDRPRIVPWLDNPHDLSFPSGHAAGTMAVLLLAALLFDRRPLIVPALLVSLAVGATRPMLGVHWPSDVVGGWLWGAGFAIAGAGIAKGMGLLDADYASRHRINAGPS